MKQYYLHIYIIGRLVYQSINDSKNDAKKDYIMMRNSYEGDVTWEIINIDTEQEVLSDALDDMVELAESEHRERA